MTGKKLNLDNMENPEIEDENLNSSASPKGAEAPEKSYEEENTKLINELKTALAEAENLRKRHMKEKEDLIKFASQSALTKLSVPFEYLFSALQTKVPEDLKDNSFIKSLFDGVSIVQKEFEKVFLGLGLKRIYPNDEKFNPAFHEAILHEEAEGKEAGTVVKVVSAGYELGGRVIKPAMVVVAK
jgi:molecular chaperone GrpE